MHTFLAVLEHGTFDAAAKELCVSAAAVSQRITSMEQAAGQVLLVRAVRVRSTPAGMAVQKLARQLRQPESDCAAELGLGGNPGAAIAVAVNADSLAAWVIAALGAIPASERHSFEVLREDEQHSAAPVLQFDRTDTLQCKFFKAVTGGSLTGSQGFLPDPSTFAYVIEDGLG